MPSPNSQTPAREPFLRQGGKGAGKSNLCRQLSKHILNMEITSSLAHSLSLLSSLFSDTSWAVVLSPEINLWIVSSPWDVAGARKFKANTKVYSEDCARVLERNCDRLLSNDKWEVFKRKLLEMYLLGISRLKGKKSLSSQCIEKPLFPERLWIVRWIKLSSQVGWWRKYF